jgi:hypothetical protein
MRLTAFYMSRDRVLSLIHEQQLPMQVRSALQGQDVAQATAVLSGAVGKYILGAVASGGVKTLPQLAFDGTLKEGLPFIYNGHLSRKGFGATNKTLALSMTEKLDHPLDGRKLVLEFSKNGLINATAYTRVSGSTRLFVFAYLPRWTPKRFVLFHM